MAETPQGGVLATGVLGVVGIVLADPAVLLEDGELVLRVLGLPAPLMPAIADVEVVRHVRAVAVEVLLAGQGGSPRGDTARAVSQRPVRALAYARSAREGPREFEVRPVAVNAAVVLGRRHHSPTPVTAAPDVQDRVTDRVLLLLYLRGRLWRAGGLVAVQEEGVRVLVVDEKQALATALQREIGQEVVVEPIPQRGSAGPAEEVAPRDEDIGAEAGRDLERVRARRSDCGEAGEAVALPGERAPPPRTGAPRRPASRPRPLWWRRRLRRRG